MTGDTSYTAPPAMDMPPKHLVVDPDGPGEQRYTFFDRIEIRRLQPDPPQPEGLPEQGGHGRPQPGVVFVDDPTVSSHHCVITQSPDGHCFIRDLSRNGSRVDGRRLVPNIEVEMLVGQVLLVGKQTQFRLEGEAAGRVSSGSQPSRGTYAGTTDEVENRTVTVLVGDIRDYTVLVQEAPATALQASVSRLFGRLEREVVRGGGTVKEHQGDALFAFWEEGVEPRAVSACRTALALHRLTEKLAQDRGVWALDDFPLKMDWALTTGQVIIHSYGGYRPTGLSMIGEPVVLAFRLEKLVSDETGPIVACLATRNEAGGAFVFDNLGSRQAKGFETPVEVFALRGPM
ncbi:MAG: adenylate/guanylate cyclase domain-containing protein [Planctomycetota bacterium]|jgi:class 3 adenylate cyclase